IAGGPRLLAREIAVPGDLSSAVFFLAAALILPGSKLMLLGVGLNPTRSAVLVENLRRMGARAEEFPDGMRVAGRTENGSRGPHGAEVDPRGDHRLAMA